jgi:hypothetical protein
MKTKGWLSAIIIALPLFGGGCCAPKELFSCIDRHCFVADWTNHYSCVSCCCHGNCQPPPQPELPMVELGNQPAEAELVQPIQ